MRAWVGAFVLLGACGGPSSGAQQVVICPAGSVLDPGKQQCVAMEGAKPVVTDDGDAGASTVATASTTASTSTTTSTSTSTSASTSATAIATPPPPATGFAVDVKCNFTKGWVSLVPASKYPKDDQFLMQALIGFTKEPSFWTGLPEYRAIQPFAAKRCSANATTRLLAPTAGDYYLLAGQEDTFSARGTYDKNGVRRKMTVNATTAVNLAPADLTHTWVCISCPWIVFRGEGGRDLAPFVVLANRRGRERRGTDVHEVAHVPVVDGRITLRVVEIENEETHLDALVLTIGGKRLVPQAAVLSGGDGHELRLGPRTQSTVTYVVPSHLARDGFVDVEVEATGYYDPL